MLRNAQLMLIPLLFCCLAHTASSKEIIDPDEAEANPNVSIEGEYLGDAYDEGMIGARVTAQGNGKSRAILYKGGLPGTGWKAGDLWITMEGTAAELKGQVPGSDDELVGKIADGKLALKKQGDNKSIVLTRIERKTPTPGDKPPGETGASPTPRRIETGPERGTFLFIRTRPDGAKVLIDGKQVGLSDDLFAVDPGVRRIIVELEGHDPNGRDVTVRAGRIERVKLELVKLGDSLSRVPQGPGLSKGDAESYQLVQLDRQDHNRQIFSVAFSPNKGTLAVGDVDGRVKIISTASRQVDATLDPFEDGQERHPAYALAWSPDGNTLAVGVGGRVILFDENTGGPKMALHDPQMERRLQEGMSPEKARRLFTVPHAHAGVGSIAFSPDGKTLVTGGGKGESIGSNREPGPGVLKLWDAETGELKKDLIGHRWDVFSVAFSPDGKTLASVSRDGTIRLWDPATGRQKQVLRTPGEGMAFSVAFSPGGKYFVSSGGRLGSDPDGASGQSIVWNARTAAVELAYTHAGQPTSHVAFSPDGRTVTVLSGNRLLLWNPRAGKDVQSVVVAGKGVLLSCVAFAPNGELLAVGGSGGAGRGSLAFWRLAGEEATESRQRYDVLSTALIDSLAFGPTREHLLLDLEGESRDTFIDLDTNTLTTGLPDADYDAREAYIKRTGIDAAAHVQDGQANLGGFRMVTDSAGKPFDQVTPRDVFDAVVRGDPSASHTALVYADSAFQTYFFGTREGTIGILEMLEPLTEGPNRGMRMRYKTVCRVVSKPGGNEPRVVPWKLTFEMMKVAVAVRKKEFLPNVDSMGEEPDSEMKAFLDLASGEMLAWKPEMTGETNADATGHEKGGPYFSASAGDLCFSGRAMDNAPNGAIICLRGARAMLWSAGEYRRAQPKIIRLPRKGTWWFGGVTDPPQDGNWEPCAYAIPNVPCSFRICTAEKKYFDVGVAEVKKGDSEISGVEVWFRPSHPLTVPNTNSVGRGTMGRRDALTPRPEPTPQADRHLRLLAYDQQRRAMLVKRPVPPSGAVRVMVGRPTPDLSDTTFTDEKLAHLKMVKNLIYADLSGAQVTDAGIQELKEHKQLMTLDLRDTAVTAEGISALQSELPHLRTVIHHSFSQPMVTSFGPAVERSIRDDGVGKSNLLDLV